MDKQTKIRFWTEVLKIMARSKLGWDFFHLTSDQRAMISVSALRNIGTKYDDSSVAFKMLQDVGICKEAR